MPDRPRNIGASVLQRLLSLAHARGQPTELLLTRYALERLLHRLSLSPHRERFVLKGAMLLATWFDEPHRATRDVDLLRFGDPAHETLLGTFREILAVELDDGVSFDLKGLRIEAIREEVEYGGSRLRTTAVLAGARVPITVDIGFGDAIFHAMVALGRANSRMKAASFDAAFRNEDEPIIEACQRNMGTTDLMSLKAVLLLLPTDGPAIRARRVLAGKLEPQRP